METKKQTNTIANNIILPCMKIIGTVDAISKSTADNNITDINFIFLVSLKAIQSFESLEDTYESKWCMRHTIRLHSLATLL
jgi:hypothetical protein